MPRPKRLPPSERPPNYIPEWAKVRGLRQADIVRLVGVQRSTASRWFRGVTPTGGHARRLVEVLGLESPAQLLMPPDEATTEVRARFLKIVERLPDEALDAMIPLASKLLPPDE